MNKLLIFLLILITASSFLCGAQDVDILWQSFLDNEDSPLGVELILEIGKSGRGNRHAVENINNYLNKLTESYTSGEAVNYSLVSACISAVLDMGDSSSYDALFAALCANYPEIISNEAAGALDLLPGRLMLFLYKVIDNYPPFDKLTAFRLSISSQTLSSSERGQLAELALETSLDSQQDADMDMMRYLAVVELTRLRWMRASPLAIENYYRVQADYYRNDAPKERLLEAIACLGAVGNSNAALVIILQLGLINAQMERKIGYDAEITIALIRSLGQIGDKAAQDHLLYITYLPYGDNVKSAAMEAFNRLQW